MRKLFLLAVLVAAGVVAWLFWQQGRPGPLVVSGFIEADEIRVGSRVGGRVSEVVVSEGQRVAEGDKLLTIDSFDLIERLAQARAELAVSRAEHGRLVAGFRPEEVQQAHARRERTAATLEKLVAGPRPKEIEIAREEVNIARANLELAQSDYDRVMRLREGAEAAQTEVDQAIRALKASQGELAAAQQRLALMEEGTRSEEIAEARAVLAEAEQALALLQRGYRSEDIAKAAAQMDAAQSAIAAIERQIEELIVRSPCDCIVEAVDLQPGDLLNANAPAMSLLDTSNFWIRAYVPEGRLGRVRLGQRVYATADGFPNERFAARVTFIAQEAEFTPRNIQTPEERSKQVFRIKVTLDEGLERLRIGMAADVWLEEGGR